MINRTVLTGRLTRDPELKYTQQGTAVLSFTLAVDRQFKNNNNEREADFINCVIWRRSAENFAKFTHKGSLIGVDGRLTTRNYDNKQGQMVYVTEVNVDNFALLDSKNNGISVQQNRQNNTNITNNGNADIDLSSLPFNSNKAEKSNELQTGDDDMPF